MKKIFFCFIFLLHFTTNAQDIQKAQYHLDRSNYEQAVPLFEKITDIAKQQKDFNLLVMAQNGLADCYMDLGANYKAMAILKQNIVILNQPKVKNLLLLAQTHQLLAICYDKLYLIEDYLNECHIFYSYYKKVAPNKEIYKALYYAYLGRYYNMRFMVEKAFTYTNSALKIYHRNRNENEIDPYILYNAHLFTARNHAPTLAIKFKYVDSLNYFVNKRYPYDNLKKARLMVSLAAPNIEVAAGLYYSSDNYKLNITCANRAISIYNKALVMNDKLAGFYHPNGAFLNSLKGLMCFYKKDYKKALENYEIGINRLTVSPYIFTSNTTILFDLLKWKAWCLDDMYTQNKDKKLLLEIDKTLLLAEKYWVHYANAVFKNKQKFNTNGYIAAPYNDLAKNYYKLYKETADDKYIALFYEYDEKSKYTSLLENLHQERKNQKSNISDAITNKTYVSFDDFILKRNNKIFSTDLKKAEFKFQEQFEVYNKHQNQNDFFTKKTTISLKEIQNNLKNNEAVISYTLSGIQSYFSSFVLMITKERIKVVDITNRHGVEQQNPLVSNLINSLNRNAISNYKKEAYEYYNVYFKPLIAHLPKSVTHIQVIPNYNLVNFPFDMMLTSYSKSNDYSKLPYLAKKYQFSYGLSSSIAKMVNQTVSNSDVFSVFSPSFVNSNLSQLNVASSESERIANTYNADLIKDKGATKQQFSKRLKENKIVALFSHGLANTDENEDTKGIYLSDGFLSLNDFYNLEAKCQFLILGACESGVGYKNNEGNINLARAFTAIGVKSMLLASWKIDEQSSIQIIRYFLSYLNSGCTKSEALQKAKMDYLALASPRTANPLYWAGLNITGNNETIRLRQTNYGWWGLLLVPVFCLGWYYRRKRKKINP